MKTNVLNVKFSLTLSFSVFCQQVGTRDFASRYNATYVSWAFAYLLGLICLIRACYWGAIKVSYPENSFA